MSAETVNRCGPLVMAAIFGLVMALGSSPLAIPDSYELIREGRCLWGWGVDAESCASINPAYWTPGWSLPVGLLSIVSSPLAAAGAVSLLAMALLVLPCWSIGRRFGGWQFGFLVAVMVLCTPALRTYGMLADGRGLSLLCLFSTWALAIRSCEKDAPVGWTLAAGGVAGFGALVRPEGILTLLLLPLFVFACSRSVRRSLYGFSSGLAIGFPWWVSLSMERGRIALSPRDWEASGFSLLEVLPKREVLELYGMGAYDTAFRRLALQTEVYPDGLGLDVPGGMDWLGRHLISAIPWWGWIATIFGLLWAVKAGRRRVLLALSFAVAPAIVAAFKPQSRDVLLPMANLLPVIVCAWILSAAAIAAMTRWALARWCLPSRIGFMPVIIIGFCIAIEGPRVDFMPSTELMDPGREASAWLRDQEVSRVRSSFESAPVVHLAGQAWDPWPSRWDFTAWSDPDRIPDLVVYTDLDDHASPADRPGLTPVAYFGDDRAWVLIMSSDERFQNRDR